MIDHIILNVTYIDEAKEFYMMALAPLEYEMIWEQQTWAAFGRDGKPFFLIQQGQKPNPPLHIAFRADKRVMVDNFYSVAIASGGKDNGKPGIREKYHPNYYGAFVFDPDGNNIEAVCHDAE
ncbi:MAG: VOC family protein [Deltaproteobacteria bacterium]|nr:VOC family protein [Deltaproteobacteria bacterium]